METKQKEVEDIFSKEIVEALKRFILKVIKEN